MINLNLKPKSLLKIKLTHDYYNNGTSSLLFLKPDIDTKFFLNCYKLVCKTGSTGIELFADAFDNISFRSFIEKTENIVF